VLSAWNSSVSIDAVQLSGFHLTCASGHILRGIWRFFAIRMVSRVWWGAVLYLSGQRNSYVYL
jgi:hypothetical protein